MGHGFSQQSGLAKVAEIGGLAAAPFAIPALLPALTGASAAGAAAATPSSLSTLLLGAAPDIAGGFTDAGAALDAAQGPFGGASLGGLLQSFARPGGPLNNALNVYGRTQGAMNALGMNQHPQMAPPVARPAAGPAPVPSSQIFGQQQSGAPLGGSAGAVGNAMGMGAGGMNLQALIQLLQQRGMA